MLNTLLLLLEETTETPTETGLPQWVGYVMLGAMAILMVLVFIIPNRKRKKEEEKMQSSMKVGATITTIGGIIGEVVEIEGNEFVLATGTEDKPKTYMRFTKQALYTVNTPKADGGNGTRAEETNEIK